MKYCSMKPFIELNMGKGVFKKTNYNTYKLIRLMKVNENEATMQVARGYLDSVFSILLLH